MYFALNREMLMNKPAACGWALKSLICLKFIDFCILYNTVPKVEVTQHQTNEVFMCVCREQPTVKVVVMACLKVLPQYFPRETGKPQKNLRIVGNPTKIKNGHLQNTTIQC
jgi:hypothetical protein